MTNIGELGIALAVTITLSTLRALCVLRLIVTANVPVSLILFTLKVEKIHSSETSVLTRATRRHVPEDGILHMVLLKLLIVPESGLQLWLSGILLVG
jgi:hypothetical protein